MNPGITSIAQVHMAVGDLPFCCVRGRPRVRAYVCVRVFFCANDGQPTDRPGGLLVHVRGF